MITGAQIRMARGYTKQSVKQLSDVSGVATSTIKRMELIEGVPNSSGANIEKVKLALESRGVQFLDTGEVALGAGVALRDREDD